MLKTVDKVMDEERALYGCENVALENCRFEGPADGESALKECGTVEAFNCFFDLRYPLWHDRSVLLENCEMTENCRAALWYTDNLTARKTRMHGIKALRECKNAALKECDVRSPEFGWFCDGVRITDSAVVSEYFMMRSKNISAQRLDFKGKYSFQYVEDVCIVDSKLDTKDAFWHGKNITVENSVIIGEYLGWFSKNLTFKNCTIIGTQPLCYCKNLRLIDCVMQKTDLSFERSEVYAILREGIDSIKNPYKGMIRTPAVGEVIRDDKNAKAKVLIDPTLKRVAAGA